RRLGADGGPGPEGDAGRAGQGGLDPGRGASHGRAVRDADAPDRRRLGDERRLQETHAVNRVRTRGPQRWRGVPMKAERILIALALVATPIAAQTVPASNAEDVFVQRLT